MTQSHKTQAAFIAYIRHCGGAEGFAKRHKISLRTTQRMLAGKPPGGRILAECAAHLRDEIKKLTHIADMMATPYITAIGNPAEEIDVEFVIIDEFQLIADIMDKDSPDA